MLIPQGDIRVLDDPIAQHLLASTEPARVAYVAKTRIALRAGWVGALDFCRRFPGGLVAAGLTPQDGS
jgi:hypothetical protein